MALTSKLSILVLSCDLYEDIWDDFFNLKEIYWFDCDFKTYLVNNEKQYYRSGVSVVNGRALNWSGRYRLAVKTVKTPYVCVLLDDFFIKEKVDNLLIKELVDYMEKEDVSFLNLSDVFNSILGMKHINYYSPHEVVIPKHKKYGISTSAAIWKSDYLLEKLGTGDYSAWEFEIDRCKEARSGKGMDGLLLCDDRKPLHITELPIVIQGKFYPPAINYFKKLGYSIDYSHREMMNSWEVLRYQIKEKFSNVRFGRNFFKWIASNIFNYKFFVDK